MTVHSFPQTLARKRAREKSLAEPVFGLEEGEGVVCGLGANAPGGFVLEMEHRRKSGRGVGEWFFVGRGEKPVVLGEHPLFSQGREEVEFGGGGVEATFEMGVTDAQRRVREGVVLPYFDAQGGRGEGGRILYDLGVEDDFDEEEDEI